MSNRPTQATCDRVVEGFMNHTFLTIEHMRQFIEQHDLMAKFIHSHGPFIAGDAYLESDDGIHIKADSREDNPEKYSQCGKVLVFDFIGISENMGKIILNYNTHYQRILRFVRRWHRISHADGTTLTFNSLKNMIHVVSPIDDMDNDFPPLTLPFSNDLN